MYGTGAVHPDFVVDFFLDAVDFMTVAFFLKKCEVYVEFDEFYDTGELWH